MTPERLFVVRDVAVDDELRVKCACGESFEARGSLEWLARSLALWERDHLHQHGMVFQT